MTEAFASPRRLLVLDPEVFAAAQPATIRQFLSRLGKVRRETVLALLAESVPEGVVLPDPDYLVAPGGARLVRQPVGETVAGWPLAGEATEAGAVRHLAEALLVPSGQVFVVAGAGHKGLLAAADKAIAVGLDQPPQGAIALARNGTAHLNRVLEDLQLFLKPARRISDLCDEAFQMAIASLRRSVTEMGFTAASIRDNPLREHDANYAATWSRDGVITGLWSLCLEDEELRAAFRRTLEVLADHQTPTGQIPANVRIDGTGAEYCGLGGIASIDAVLWFVIGVARYSFASGDAAFAGRMVDRACDAMDWLGAHDSNNDGLLEIPEASDWMDLFPRSYNVLYDEVLWHQACLDHAALLEAVGRDGGGWRSHAETVKRRILESLWPTGQHLQELAAQPGTGNVSSGPFLLCYVTPFDYSWRCDVYANLLAALTGLLDADRCDQLFHFLWGVGVNSPFPVACLYPPVQSGAEDWKDYFIVNFLNLPDHYHNGGIWPFIGGLWVRFLYHIGRRELAHRELGALAEACRQGVRGEWEFNEWLHGRTGRPMGKAHQAWSAASYVKAYMTLTEETEPAAFEPLEHRQLS